MLPKRIVITMQNEADQKLIARVIEFRFEYRYNSLAGAARGLLEMGLKAEKSLKPPTQVMKRKR